ncbi:MAG TPA: phosphate acetyltransferase [Bacteroidia bacterium]|mgnify:CR=1 FL=1|nr:phosphate acetyltransferase [Sphingobacteriales bacterium]HPD65492.1 phosphate acetyltransferase [Bacteroidia bacterium]HRS59147.1 phosphate acetyltransferase [Bacteroidia bacterium]HRU67443.1 phosphate acetyltransferase [Bacteroidia bacterium]
MTLLESIHENAKKLNKRIVLPEAWEERTLRAADIAISTKIAQITLIGDEKMIHAEAEKFGLKNIAKATIVNPDRFHRMDEYAEMLYNLRKNKGMTPEEAKKLVKDPLYLGVMLIKSGEVDGEVAGANNATGDVFRPALQIVKTMPGISIVSSTFLMLLKDKSFGEDGLILFADCALNPDPDAKQLADIAIATAHTARALGRIEPRVAMLSFSTKGSASHPLVDKVVEAVKIAKQIAPDLKIDGELQADAALIESIGKKKAPGSEIAGRANVLIFPDLQSGNIAYKLVQRLAGAEAVGPVTQGMAAPINDLSRGCSVDDIVNVIAITANQAGGV